MSKRNVFPNPIPLTAKVQEDGLVPYRHAGRKILVEADDPAVTAARFLQDQVERVRITGLDAIGAWDRKAAAHVLKHSPHTKDAPDTYYERDDRGLVVGRQRSAGTQHPSFRGIMSETGHSAETVRQNLAKITRGLSAMRKHLPVYLGWLRFPSVFLWENADDEGQPGAEDLAANLGSTSFAYGGAGGAEDEDDSFRFGSLAAGANPVKRKPKRKAKRKRKTRGNPRKKGGPCLGDNPTLLTVTNPKRAKKSKTERDYDALYNEGGEGFSPHRRPILEDYEPADRRDALVRDLERLDCSAARASGTFSPSKVAKIRAEIAAIDAEEARAFAAEWTAAVTRERRASWNARARAGEFSSARKQVSAEDAQGWTVRDLKRAVDMHKPNPKRRRATKKKRATAARAGYRKLHAADPENAHRLWMPDRVPKSWITLGQAVSVTYCPTNRSQLADESATATHLTHKFSRSVLLVCDASGRLVCFADTKRTGPRARAMHVSGLAGESKLGIVG